MALALRDSIEQLTGKKVTDQHIQKILAVASGMEIGQNDPMLLLFLVLDHYNGLFNEAPKKINDAVNNSVKTAEREAELVVNDASRKVQTIVAGSLEPLATAAFDKGVKKYIDDLTGQAESAARSKTMPVAIAAAAGVLLVGLMLGWGSGTWARSDADEKLIAAAAVSQKTVAAQLAQKDAEAAATIANLKADQATAIANLSAAKGWAGTPEGQLAYKFFTAGGGVLAARCQAERWIIGKTGKGEKLCVPQVETFFGWKDGNIGWVIP